MAVNFWSLTIFSVILLGKVTKAALYTKNNYWNGTRKYSYYSTRKYSYSWNDTRKYSYYATRKFSNWINSNRKYSYDGNRKYSYPWNGTRKYSYSWNGTRKFSSWNNSRKYSYDGNKKYSYSWNGTRKYSYGNLNETRKYSYWGSPKYSYWNGSRKYSSSGTWNNSYNRTWKFGVEAVTKDVTTESTNLHKSTSKTSRETTAFRKTRKYYSRKLGTRTTKSKTTRTTTLSTISTGITRTTVERIVWPWNTLQYYETLGPETTTIQILYFLRNPNGTDAPYYYPNRTEAEHQAMVAKRKGRANNTAWCKCGHCDPMDTDEDSVCCREDWYFNRLISMVSYEENQCYAETAMVYMALREPDLEDYRSLFLTNEKRHLPALYGVDFRNRTQTLWRWLAYRYIIRGLNLMTEYEKGRFNETVPACIVKAVRGEFPEPDGKYRKTGWSVFQSIRLPG